MRTPELETVTTQTQVQEWVTKGKSRKWIMEKLQKEGLTIPAANHIYYGALKELTPEPNLLDDYKKSLIQTNLDRLEEIINTSISGNTGDKKVALQAIDTLNKMIGIYNDKNHVTIAKDNQNNEVIQITFDR